MSSSTSPLKVKTGDATANSKDFSRLERRKHTASEMMDSLVGSPAPRVFLRTWFPKKDLPSHSQLKAIFPDVEKDFRSKFRSSLNHNEHRRTILLSEYVNTHQLLGDKLEFRDTHASQIKFRGYELMPDGQIRHKLGHSNSAYPPHALEGEERESVPCDIVLEFKTSASSDPFRDVQQVDNTWALSVKSLSEEKTLILGQLADYAHMMLHGTFRTHAFMVFFAGNYARFLRWDHSTVVVSKRFDYVHDPLVLVAFFQAYANTDAATRGWDTTVTAVPPAEERRLRRRINRHYEEYNDAFEAPLVKFCVRDGQKTVECIGSARPNFTAYHLLGRATCGWIVYNTDSKTLMYYKRSWRIAEDGLEQEGAVYERLHQAGVPHIPTIVAHGDIEGQWHLPTKTFIKDQPWMLLQEECHGKLRAQQHYHLLMKEVGIRLTDFPRSKVAVRAIRDAIIACEAALTKANTMHRDISAGNILIWKDKDGDYHGLLVDWDLCKLITDDKARSNYRTGTWAFLSAKRQLQWNDPDAEHVPEDDRESFVHVVTWLGNRYCATNLTKKQVMRFLRKVFDLRERDSDDEEDGGSSLKVTYLLTGVKGIVPSLRKPFRVEGNVPLTKLLDSLRSLFESRYLADPSPVLTAGDDKDDSDSDSDFDSDSDDDEIEDDVPSSAVAVAARVQVQARDLRRAFKAALKMPGWPKDDKAFDYLPYKARSGYMAKGAEKDAMLKTISAVSEARRASSLSSKRVHSAVTDADADKPPSKRRRSAGAQGSVVSVTGGTMGMVASKGRTKTVAGANGAQPKAGPSRATSLPRRSRRIAPSRTK